MTTVWLAANYHFPSTYSCRIPMSSMSSAPVMPTPGPATIRMALLRTGIEYIGLESVRDEVFPTLRSIPLWIRPPDHVAISKHLLRIYKWEQSQRKSRSGFQESMAVREMAHSSGLMTVYVEVPSNQEEWYRTLLRSIGYWGQTDSLTHCTEITRQSPPHEECAQPLSKLMSNRPLQHFFSCVASEFRDVDVTWDEITLGLRSAKMASPLRLDIYVWPLVLERVSVAGRLLIRCPLTG